MATPRGNPTKKQYLLRVHGSETQKRNTGGRQGVAQNTDRDKGETKTTKLTDTDTAVAVLFATCKAFVLTCIFSSYTSGCTVWEVRLLLRHSLLAGVVYV